MARKIETILLVEDEPDIQEVARLALESFGGYKVRICSNGNEALEVAPQAMPDLILLDVMMPGMDGLATIKSLRQNPKISAIPVIFMTAKAQPNEMKEYLECGAIAVITKPFDPVKLAAQVTDIWDKRK